MIYGLLESAAKIAPLGTFCVALTAIFIAYNQLKTARQNEAKKQYLSYLDECVKYPKLASGDFVEDSKEANNKLAYLWFLNKAFMANESILLEYPNDEYWGQSIYDHLYVHIENVVIKKHLTLQDLNLKHYSTEFSTLIITIVKDINVKLPNDAED